MQLKRTSLRTEIIEPNDNISFPIGTFVTVEKYYNKLSFDKIIGKHKRKGANINALVKAMVSYRLTENQSVTKAADFINRDPILEFFSLDFFEQNTLYRTLRIIGNNREEVIADIQDEIFDIFDFEHTDLNMDWTSFVLWGTKCSLGKYGYSRDKRPDKKQINVGISELREPINIPIGLTILPGNINDQVHFDHTFGQVEGHLRDGSLMVFDQGANRKKNLNRIENSKLKYLTIRPLNKSDDKTWIKNFKDMDAELVDEEKGVYGLIKVFPSRTNYMYFSEQLYEQQMEAKFRKAKRMLQEAKDLQESIENNRGLPKRFKINNPLIDCTYSYQTKLTFMSEEEAQAILKRVTITGREGFFCLVSNKDLTLIEALKIYRQKDSIEKIFHSLKNEIEIKPLRVWSDASIYGAIIIGFIAQLIISLIRFEHAELKHTSPKFIKISLSNLTVTVEYKKSNRKRYIFSNFNPISQVIWGQNTTIT